MTEQRARAEEHGCDYMASLVAHMVKNLPVMWETWLWSPGTGRYPGEGKGNPF